MLARGWEQSGAIGLFSSGSKERLIGDTENLWRGKAQSGITISTCRDLTLEESPADFRLGNGKPKRLGWLLETKVDDREELSPLDVQGLEGATDGSYGGIIIGMCLVLVCGAVSLPGEQWWWDWPGHFAESTSIWDRMREAADSTDRLFLLDSSTRLSFNAFGRFGPLFKGVVLALHAG
jgi:hypothetical protein